MASELSVFLASLPAMNGEAIDRVRSLESLAMQAPQVEIDTSHIIHGGMYARTIMIPAGVMLTGALIKIATLLIVQGDVLVYIGDKTIELTGYNVLPASANRKQAFFAKTNTFLTMIFPSQATDIESAELEFTDETNMLISRKNSFNKIIITGE